MINFINALSYISPIISAFGAFVAWLAFSSKKPQLSVNISVKAAPLPQNMGNMISTTNAWSLIINIKNNGDKEAHNIELKLIRKFKDSSTKKLVKQRDMIKKISGDLSPKEEIEILIPVNKGDTQYADNHLDMTLDYQDSFLFRSRKYKRGSTWFFNLVNGILVSDKMNRIDKFDQIPADISS